MQDTLVLWYLLSVIYQQTDVHTWLIVPGAHGLSG